MFSQTHLLARQLFSKAKRGLSGAIMSGLFGSRYERSIKPARRPLMSINFRRPKKLRGVPVSVLSGSRYERSLK